MNVNWIILIFKLIPITINKSRAFMHHIGNLLKESLTLSLPSLELNKDNAFGAKIFDQETKRLQRPFLCWKLSGFVNLSKAVFFKRWDQPDQPMWCIKRTLNQIKLEMIFFFTILTDFNNPERLFDYFYYISLILIPQKEKQQ